MLISSRAQHLYHHAVSLHVWHDGVWHGHGHGCCCIPCISCCMPCIRWMSGDKGLEDPSYMCLPYAPSYMCLPYAHSQSPSYCHFHRHDHRACTQSLSLAQLLPTPSLSPSPSSASASLSESAASCTHSWMLQFTLGTSTCITALTVSCHTMCAVLQCQVRLHALKSQSLGRPLAHGANRLHAVTIIVQCVHG